MLVIAFNSLIQIERWLHQHIFKVGWLVTKNFQTTTILYYTFFLPGVFLYEVVYWLAAGALNVRADRAITWPESQEIGELRLNFVKLAKKTPTWKTSLINLAPVVVGILTIWFIANNVFDVAAIAETLSEGTFAAFGDAIGQLTGATDFWLWAYLLFTVSNTMLPDTGVFKGWQWVAGALVLVSIPLFFLGVGEQIIGDALTGPVGEILNALLLVFVVMIVFDSLAVALLSLIENTIEYITGDSAMFKNGKMIVMTREEALEQRRKERESARKQSQKTRKPVTTQGPPSVYKLEFPLPGPPGKEPVSTLPVSIVQPDEEPAIRPDERPKRAEPTIISGKAERRDVRIGPPPETLRDDAEDDDADAASAQPSDRDIRFNVPGKPQTEANNNEAQPENEAVDAESDEGERPPSRVSGPKPVGLRPSSFASKSASEKEPDNADDKHPLSQVTGSKPGGLRPRPSPFAPKSTGEGKADDEPTALSSVTGPKPGALRPRPSPFARDKSDEEMASSEDKANEDDTITYKDVDDSA